MNKLKRDAEIARIYADAGARSYAARLRHMERIYQLGQEYDRAVAKPRKDYQDGVAIIEADLRDLEEISLKIMRSKLAGLG